MLHIFITQAHLYTESGDVNALKRLISKKPRIIHLLSYFSDKKCIKGLPIESSKGGMAWLADDALRELVSASRDVMWIVQTCSPVRIAHFLVDAGAAHVLAVHRHVCGILLAA